MKTKKVIAIILIILLAISFNTISFADKINPDDFKPGEPTIVDAGKSIDLAEKIIGGIQIIGTILSIAILMFIGIKYMMGSIEEKAEYKKSMIPYMIGAILLFGTSWIVNFIYNVTTKSLNG